MKLEEVDVDLIPFLVSVFNPFYSLPLSSEMFSIFKIGMASKIMQVGVFNNFLCEVGRRGYQISCLNELMKPLLVDVMNSLVN